MSLFNDERYCWRETYFIVCSPALRPKFAEFSAMLEKSIPTLRIRDKKVDSFDSIEFLSVVSLEDKSGLDIVYQENENSLQETAALLDEIQQQTTTDKTRQLADKASSFTGRLDVLHFEQTSERTVNEPDLPTMIVPPKIQEKPKQIVAAKLDKNKRFSFDPNALNPKIPDYSYSPMFGANSIESDPFDTSEFLDPNTLILVTELLISLTHGVGIDPASGTLF